MLGFSGHPNPDGWMLGRVGTLGEQDSESSIEVRGATSLEVGDSEQVTRHAHIPAYTGALTLSQTHTTHTHTIMTSYSLRPFLHRSIVPRESKCTRTYTYPTHSVAHS